MRMFIDVYLHIYIYTFRNKTMLQAQTRIETALYTHHAGPKDANVIQQEEAAARNE